MKHKGRYLRSQHRKAMVATHQLFYVTEEVDGVKKRVLKTGEDYVPFKPWLRAAPQEFAGDRLRWWHNKHLVRTPRVKT